MRVLIAVPSFDTKADIDVFKAIYDLSIPEGCEVDLEFITGYDCAKARNDIAKKTVKGNYDAVLMVDSDIMLPKDALTKLLNNDLKICFGVYPRKYTDEVECIKIDRPYMWDIFTIEEAKDKRDIVEIKAAGFGCAFIKTEVFHELNFPYFKYESFEDGSLLSEDFYFCEKAREAGFTIYADFDIRCTHIGRLKKQM